MKTAEEDDQQQQIIDDDVFNILLLLLLFPHISPISRTRGHRVQGAYHPYPN